MLIPAFIIERAKIASKHCISFENGHEIGTHSFKGFFSDIVIYHFTVSHDHHHQPLHFSSQNIHHIIKHIAKNPQYSKNTATIMWQYCQHIVAMWCTVFSIFTVRLTYILTICGHNVVDLNILWHKLTTCMLTVLWMLTIWWIILSP